MTVFSAIVIAMLDPLKIGISALFVWIALTLSRSWAVRLVSLVAAFGACMVMGWLPWAMLGGRVPVSSFIASALWFLIFAAWFIVRRHRADARDRLQPQFTAEERARIDRAEKPYLPREERT